MILWLILAALIYFRTEMSSKYLNGEDFYCKYMVSIPFADKYGLQVAGLT